MLETDSLTIHNDWRIINHWVFLRGVSSRFSTGNCSKDNLKSCDTKCRLLLCKTSLVYGTQMKIITLGGHAQ